VGSGNLTRSSATIVRLSAAHPIGDGSHGDWSADLGYVGTSDDNIGVACDPNTLATCWGASKSRTLSVDGEASYRLGRSWLAIGSLELADQQLQVTDAAKLVAQPSIILITAFARLSYRF
jgi:hypothetical protein